MKKNKFLKLSIIVLTSSLFIISCKNVNTKDITITFDAKGGAVAPKTIKVKKGTTWKEVDDRPVPVKYGYSFSYWSNKDDQTEIEDSFAFNDDATLFAVYSTNTYTVTFDSDGGTPISSQQISFGGYATKPVDPIKEDDQHAYNFIEWQLDGRKFNFETTKIRKDITLKAKWVEETRRYTVNFNSDGGTLISPVRVFHGRKLKKPDDPKKDSTVQYDYSFKHWELSGEPFDFNTPITGDITLDATYNATLRKYTIRFLNYDSSILQSSDVEFGETPVYKGETPTKERTPQYTYTFAGWDSTIAPVSGNKDYIATFTSEINKYTVTFNSDGGTSIEPQSINYGECATKPTDPTKERTQEFTYTFKEWQLDGKPFDFNTTIINDITLKAVYTETINKYTVTFDSDGGTIINPQTVDYNTCASKPTDPIKASTSQFNYYFIEWQLGGVKFDFNTPITEDITLKAIYNQVEKFTVTFNTNGGSKIDPIIVENGTIISKPNDPIKMDYEYNYPFVEWRLNGVPFNFSTPITSNITLDATYGTGILWWEDTPYVNNLGTSDIGTIRGVTVNGNIHEVRLIDINHDVDENNNPIHTTWEFNTLISDSNGFSLGVLGNDVSTINGSNLDYPNSTIRKTISGSGNGEISWYQYESTTKSTTYKTSVLDMLPNSLTQVLKTVKKTVGTGSNYDETEYTDKLFQLSLKEMGINNDSDKGYGSVYSYYYSEEVKPNTFFVKKQVKNDQKYLFDKCLITDCKLKGWYVYSYAGFNYKTEDDGGGYYWTKSISSNRLDNIDNSSSYGFTADGYIANIHLSCQAPAVAPAFCI